MDEGGSTAASRFTHLLQPIRDLTKNWDIDVASQLEEYLSELEQITITFDGGRTAMNFAEAALLIQGSTGIYSRKVEYLYALVYQMLDLIATKKKSGHSSSDDPGGGGTEDQSCTTERRDPVDEFLTLDDVKEAANVEMVEDKRPQDHPVSKSLCTVVPRTPMSLTPLSEPERILNTPLYSKNGELLGNKLDFKMNTSTVHKSGALLLEPTNQIILELGRDTTGRPRININWTNPCSPCPPLNEGDNQYNDEMEVDTVPQDTSFNDLPQPFSPDEGGGGMGECGEGSEGIHSRLHPEVDVKSKIREQEVKESVLPSWKKTLDPHELVKSEKRPFKRGSTQKPPPHLRKEEKLTRKRRKSSTEAHPPSVSSKNLSEFLYHSFYSYSSQFPKNSFNAPSTAEFEAQFWSEQKRRKVSRAKENIKLVRLRKRKATMEAEKLVEEEEGDLDDDGGGDGTFFEPVGPENIDGLIQLQDNDNQIGQLFTRLEHAEHFQGVDPMAIEDQSTNPLGMDTGNVVQSYENMVRQYVQSTLTAAASYAQETELSKRVREWEERIKPTLLKEEQNSVFDIHSCGSDIVDTLSGRISQGQNTCTCEFKDLVKNKDPSEICRMFTASLQLANDQNVQISSEGVGEDSVDTMSLTLLSSQTAKDLITNFRAPSISTVPSSQSSSSVGEENVPEIVQNDENNIQTNVLPTHKTVKTKKTARNKERKKR